MTEREGDDNPQPQPLYCRAARFHNERLAERAYFRIERAIYLAECDLSVFRLQLSRIPHVAVLGMPPPEVLERRIRNLLANGEPATVPEEILKLLSERRARAIEQGPWVEGHYRPEWKP